MKLKFRKNISTPQEIKMQRAQTEKIDLGEDGVGGGGGYHSRMKRAGVLVLVVTLRGVNQRFCSHLYGAQDEMSLILVFKVS